MEPHILFFGALLALLPISELRGAIPYLLANGASIPFSYGYCVIFNALIGPAVLLFLATFHTLLIRMNWYRKLFERFVARARGRVKKEVDKYGYWGLMVFVAIPLPITGAWTGALGSWILGMEKKRSILAIACGVCISGLIVSIVAWSGIEAFSFLLKKF